MACSLTVCAQVEWLPMPRSRLDENFRGNGLERSRNGDGAVRSDACDLFNVSARGLGRIDARGRPDRVPVLNTRVWAGGGGRSLKNASVLISLGLIFRRFFETTSLLMVPVFGSKPIIVIGDILSLGCCRQTIAE